MGFDASICVYPKYKDVTYKDIKIINSLIEYEISDWAQKNFENAAEYAKYNNEDYREQSSDVIDFYRNKLIEDGFGYQHLYKDYANWCSNGAGTIYDFITELGSPIYENEKGVRLLSKTNIADIMMFCLDKIEECAPKPATIKYAYKYQRNEDNEIEDDANITLFTCDGFEVDFEDSGASKRIDTNPDWEVEVGFPEVYCSDWEMSGYKEGLRACAKILSEVDFENSFIIYNGGW